MDFSLCCLVNPTPTRTRGNRSDKKAAGQKPDGQTESPSGAKPEGPKCVCTLYKKIPRRKAGDFQMTYIIISYGATIYDSTFLNTSSSVLTVF